MFGDIFPVFRHHAYGSQYLHTVLTTLDLYIKETDPHTITLMHSLWVADDKTRFATLRIDLIPITIPQNRKVSTSQLSIHQIQLSFIFKGRDA